MMVCFKDNIDKDNLRKLRNSFHKIMLLHFKPWSVLNNKVIGLLSLKSDLLINFNILIDSQLHHVLDLDVQSLGNELPSIILCIF